MESLACFGRDDEILPLSQKYPPSRFYGPLIVSDVFRKYFLIVIVFFVESDVFSFRITLHEP